MAAVSSSSSPRGRSTRERLLQAAAEVFAREGLTGATTREIARRAEVNEVTLFRHFQNKEGLISAVVNRTLDAVSAGEDAKDPSRGGDPSAPETLPGVLQGFVEAYQALMTQHLPLIRTFIGEIHRHGDQDALVLRSLFRPQRDQLTQKLCGLQARGSIRQEVDVTIVADQLSAMIFGHTIRQASTLSRGYGAQQYLAACVSLVVRGIEAPLPAETSVVAKRTTRAARSAKAASRRKS